MIIENRGEEEIRDQNREEEAEACASTAGVGLGVGDHVTPIVVHLGNFDAKIHQKPVEGETETPHRNRQWS